MLFSFALNIGFFLVGGMVTFLYHQTSLSVVDRVWLTFTDQQWLLLFLYSLFIVMIGFLIGKEYGARFEAHINTVLLVTMSPNFIFMIAIVYSWIPQQWFEPMLTPAFIIICALLTISYYPLSKLAYRLGQWQV